MQRYPVRLRMRLVDRCAGTPVDVLVTASPATALNAVAPELLAALGRRAGRLSVAGRPVDPGTLLGHPPLVDGAVVTVDAGVAEARPRGLLELRVVAGPDAGEVLRLNPGEHAIGRAAGCAVRLADPDVSRLHAALEVSTDGTAVRDLGSTNGTAVDDTAVGHADTPLPPFARLRVGGSVLVVAPAQAATAEPRPDGTGGILVDRPPRLLAPAPTVSVTLPTAPPTRQPPRLPAVAIAAPLLLGLVLALVLDPRYAIFVLLSPAMLLGTFVTERATGRRDQRRDRDRHEAALALARQRLRRAAAEDADRRRLACPDAAELLLAVSGPGPRLWERRPQDADFLSVRLGTADLPAAVTVSGQASPGGLGADGADPPVARAVPLTVSLRQVGVLGLSGPRDRLTGLARHVVAHLAALHSPRDLRLAVLAAGTDRAETWRWAAWLPHLHPAAGEDCRLLVGLDPGQVAARVAELVACLERRSAAARESPGPGPVTVVVLDGGRVLRGVPGVARLLDDGPAAGIYAVCLEENPVALPSECRATAGIEGPDGTRVRLVVDTCAAVTGAGDLVSPRWAERFALRAAALRDATPVAGESTLPRTLRLLDLLSFDPTDAAALAERWSVTTGSAAVPVGAAADGPLVLDLAREGPHLLVAGTTGAGKSELLRTLVASLAASNPPDAVSFVLVDYKGGSAFGECARLPHTVGLVTDLDGQLTERALTSLGAELRRRERLLRDSGARDLGDYRAHPGGAPPGGAPLPRLVLVVDEFAALAEELPDFVTGLVGVAQRGRSLGIHLVLATQRPGGVVSADIRANTNLRVALRVTDPENSVDVIDVRDAAAISPATPGRACLRVGTGPVTAFQCARVDGGGPVRQAGLPRVERLEWNRMGDPVRARTTAPPTSLATSPSTSPPTCPPTSPANPPPTDLARLAAAAEEAASMLGIRAPWPPWLPPLPAVVPRDALPPLAHETVPVALLDLPGEQRRAAYGLDLRRDSSLLVAGGPRSGRSTVLRTVAAGVARYDPRDVHVYAIEGSSGGLAPVAALPHCGAVVGAAESGRGARLLARLAAEIDRRHDVLARSGLPSVAEQRATGAGDRLPWIVLLVDGWEAVLAAYDTVDHGRPVEVLLRILRDGAAAGVRAVVTGGRTAITGRLGSVMGDRLILHFPDPADAALAGIPARRMPAVMPPGRGILLPGAVEAQVAVPAADPSGAGQVAALRQLTTAASRPAGDVSPSLRPLRVDPLPRSAAAHQLLDLAAAAATGPLWALLGVGGDDAAPVGVDLARDGAAFVVAGPAGSGRSTALVTVTRWLTGRGVRVAVVAPRQSPLGSLAGRPGVLGPYGVADAGRLRDAASTPDPLVLVVDDAEALADTPMEAALSDLRRGPDPPRALVVAGNAADMAAAYRGLTVEARRHRRGLLLAPSGGVDGDLLGTRVGRLDEVLPGRGVLVERGRVVPVQVARWPDPRQE